MSREEMYLTITLKIKEKLAAGVIPWRKSWKSSVPMNFVSKRPYNGINYISLILNEFPSPYYLTFLQCKERNITIHKGATGSPIIFYKVMDYPVANLVDTVNSSCKEKRKSIPIVKLSYVFNLSQTTQFEKENTEIQHLECETLLNQMTEKPIIKHNIDRCYYNSTKDYISLPPIKNFDFPGEYYSALFHELAHWTGHKSRLNRKLLSETKEEEAFEELIAEISSSYLCSICGLDSPVLENQASYISGWLNLINNRESAFIQAVHESRKVVDYLLGNGVVN